MDPITTKIYLIHREFIMKNDNLTISQYNKVFNSSEFDPLFENVSKEYQMNGNLDKFIKMFKDNEVIEFAIHLQNELDK